MTFVIVAVAIFLAVVLIVATVGLCMAAKRGDRALGYEDDDERP